MIRQVVAAAAAAFGLCTAAGAAVMAVRRRRQAKLAASVRPILYRAIEGGQVDFGSIEALDRARQRAVEAQALALLPKVRGEDREALARLLDGRGVVEAARRRAGSRRPRSRLQAGDVIGRAGSPAAVTDLVHLLQDPDPRVRWTAARGLGNLGHPTALAPLLASLEGRRTVPVDVVSDAIAQIRDCPMSVLRQGLRSRSEPTRAVTVELLGRFQALSLAGDVIQILASDSSPEVRARAARALGRMSSPRAVDPLVACLADGPMAVRAQAVWALGEIGSPDAIPVLRDALVGPSRQLSELAAMALAAVGGVGKRVLAQVAEGDGHPATNAGRALAAVPDFALLP